MLNYQSNTKFYQGHSAMNINSQCFKPPQSVIDDHSPYNPNIILSDEFLRVVSCKHGLLNSSMYLTDEYDEEEYFNELKRTDKALRLNTLIKFPYLYQEEPQNIKQYEDQNLESNTQHKSLMNRSSKAFLPKLASSLNLNSDQSQPKSLLQKTSKLFIPKSACQPEVSTEKQSPIPGPLMTLLKSSKLNVDQIKLFKDLEICKKVVDKDNKNINSAVLNRKVEKRVIELNKRSRFGIRIRKESNNCRGKLESEAKEWLKQLLKTDRGKVLKHAKELLNKITPDNKKTIKEQFKQVLLECQEDHRSSLINIFIRKAINEDKYMPIYADLVKDIGEWEYSTSELTTSQQNKESQKTKIKKAKSSKFAMEIIQECKTIFSKFSDDVKFEADNEVDRDDMKYRYKKKLLGNLKFVAQLYNKKMVGSKVCYLILYNLLGKKNMKLTELTIEGACVFLERTGKKLESHFLSKNPEGGSKDGKESNKSIANFEEIIQTLHKIQNDQGVSSRIRILIKNTLQKRDNDWTDSLQNDGPKTKYQIKKDHLRELQGLQDDFKSKQKITNKNGSKNLKKQKPKLSHFDSNLTATSEIDSESDKYDEHVLNEYSLCEQEHLDHEALKDKFIGNFSEWLSNNQISIEVFHSPQFKCSGDKIIEFLLYKLYDKKERDILKFKDYFFLLYNKGLFTSADIEKGFSSYFTIIPDIESDFPHLPLLFSDLLYFIFVDKKLAEFKNIKISFADECKTNCMKIDKEESENSDEESLCMVEIYYKIIGLFLSKIEESYPRTDFKSLYNKFKVSELIEKLKPYMQDNSFLDELKEEFKISKNIIELLSI